MRRDGIPYVSNGVYNPPFPAVPLQDMTLEEIKKKYLKMCAKSYGDVSVCSQCPTPCPEGKRAIQLVSNQVYDDPPIPLYGGKTLIEKAREENMLRRQQKELKPKMSKDNRMYIDDWYEKAEASGDPVKWVMDNYNISKTKAKSKIYAWRYRHQEPKEVKEEVKEEPKVIKEEPKEPNSIEAKIDVLMKLQEKHKKIMQEYLEQYEKAKQNYEEISKKIDILCNAMDILDS